MAVNDGDMFYIKHNSDNFTIIDCNLSEDNGERIVSEILAESQEKGIVRFISTHPDDDHICGLEYLDDRMKIRNFYCVKNEATKADETTDFERYCELRDSSKVFYIEKGCSRRWMNVEDEERKSSGIDILWPDVTNSFFKEELDKDGKSPNNISPIIQYSLVDGVRAMWMGDLEEAFLENIEDDLKLPKIDVLFAPHHGREKVPTKLLDDLNPKLIIIGEAPSHHLHYFRGYNTITQNSAGDAILECVENKIHIYVSNDKYKVDFLDQEGTSTFGNYIGTLNL